MNTNKNTKKKIVSMLLALTLVAGATGVSFGATNSGSWQLSLRNILKAWTSYFVSQQQPDQNQNQNQDSSSGTTGAITSSKATEILNLVNKERQSAGLSNLTLSSNLNKVAQLKAEDMAKNNYFSHTSPTYGSAFDMLKTYGISYRTAGENIAKGQKTSQSVMSGWMNSQGHRANILKSSYGKLGVGYATDASGTTYWVQIFTD